jgi:formylglycine-generating enzyme required for sulfatase activity
LFIGLAANAKKKGPFKEPPLGTVYLKDSLYLDKQPVRVSDYLEFLSDIRRGYTSKMHDSILKLPLYNLSPDIAFHLYDSLKFDSIFYERMLTRTWQVLSSDRKVFGVDYHLLSSKYYSYPLVNVNFYQMFEYCRWRTDKVRLYYAVKCKTLKQREKYPMNFKYRLPQRKEWELAMSLYFDDVEKLSESMNDQVVQNTEAPYFSNGRQSFYYNSTNVGEYLDGGIVTTGFNWHEKYGIGDVRYIYFDKPTDWIGFRCICEVLPSDGHKPAKVEKPSSTAQKQEETKPAKPKKEKEKKLRGIKAEKVKRKR